MQIQSNLLCNTENKTAGCPEGLTQDKTVTVLQLIYLPGSARRQGIQRLSDFWEASKYRKML